MPSSPTFAGHPVLRDAHEWAAAAHAALPAGFHFPMILSERRETQRSDRTSTWDLRARNTSKDQFRCTLSLIRDGPDTPNPCWRLASFDILPNNTG